MSNNHLSVIALQLCAAWVRKPPNISGGKIWHDINSCMQSLNVSLKEILGQREELGSGHRGGGSQNLWL